MPIGFRKMIAARPAAGVARHHAGTRACFPQMPNIAKEQLDPEHLLVLSAVNKAPDGVPTKTHHRKMMHLILKAPGSDPRTGAGCIPHHHGPYSPLVDSWRDVLLESGYLVRNSREKIRIAPDAKADVDTITLGNRLLEAKIENVAMFVCSLTYDEVILYIHTDDAEKGEGMIVDSDAREGILGRRADIAKGMVSSGKVSVAKGAELADMDVASFMRLLGGAGIAAE